MCFICSFEYLHPLESVSSQRWCNKINLIVCLHPCIKVILAEVQRVSEVCLPVRWLK